MRAFSVEKQGGSIVLCPPSEHKYLATNGNIVMACRLLVETCQFESSECPHPHTMK